MNTGDGKITLQQAFDKFIAEKKAMQSSDETIIGYKRKFKSFAEFFSADNLCCEVSSCTIIQFIEFLQKKES